MISLWMSLRAFVGENGFEIVRVAHDAVIVHDAVGAQNIAGFARGVHGDLTLFIFSIEMCAGIHAPLVLQAAHLQREQLCLGDFGDHPHQFVLHQLMGSDGLVLELLALFRVLQRGVVARHGRADRAPADAVTRLH